MKLSELKCKNAKPLDKPYKLTDGKGLFLLVTKDGSKYWRYNYRFYDKQKTLSLGVYPEISLSEARELHREAHKQVKLGEDPSLERKRSKLVSKDNHENTFELIAREWLEKRDGEIKKETLKDITNRLEKEVFPKIGNLPIISINSPIILSTLKSIESRGVYETTKRCRQYISQVFKYAIVTGRADNDPSQATIGALKTRKVKHQNSMPLTMLPEFLAKIEANESRLFRQTILALKLMTLTFTRKRELTEATWDEFNLDDKIWIISANRMKMDREHIVPLSIQAIEILQELKQINGDWEHVFTSQVKPRKPMNEDTPLRAIYSLGYKGIHTAHGFRALAMTTILEKLKYNFDIVDAQLAHAKKGSLGATYDRSQYLDERVSMMQDWADYIDSIHPAYQKPKVVNLRKVKG